MAFRYSFFIICLLLMTPRLLQATADGPDFWVVSGVLAGDSLKIRAQPNGKGQIVGEILPGAKGIQNLGEFYPPRETDFERPKWCKVKYKEITGWSACRYLTGDQNP